MWIRSQDQEALVNLDNTAIIKYLKLYDALDENGPIHVLLACLPCGNGSSEIELGRYYTIQRIMEILEEIEEVIIEDTCSVYYMPEK